MERVAGVLLGAVYAFGMFNLAAFLLEGVSCLSVVFCLDFSALFLRSAFGLLSAQGLVSRESLVSFIPFMLILFSSLWLIMLVSTDYSPYYQLKMIFLER